MSFFCAPVFCSLLCLTGKSREVAQSESKTGFSLLPDNRVRDVVSARTRRINDCKIPARRIQTHNRPDKFSARHFPVHKLRFCNDTLSFRNYRSKCPHYTQIGASDFALFSTVQGGMLHMRPYPAWPCSSVVYATGSRGKLVKHSIHKAAEPS